MSGGIKHALVAVLLVGLCHPMASGQDVRSNQSIRLVTGKQPGSRKDMVHRAAPTGRSPGLFDRLMSFGGRSEDESSSKTTPLPDSQREPADWAGVPYHEPNRAGATAARNQSRPIVDPGRTRVATAPSTRPRSNVGPVPTPPGINDPSLQATASTAAETSAAPEIGSEPDPFSPTFSSRRNARRSIDPLSDDILSASDLKPRSSGTSDIGNKAVDLSDAPHVKQRQLNASSQAQPVAQPSAVTPEAVANERPRTQQPEAALSTPPSLATAATTQPAAEAPQAPSIPAVDAKASTTTAVVGSGVASPTRVAQAPPSADTATANQTSDDGWKTQAEDAPLAAAQPAAKAHGAKLQPQHTVPQNGAEGVADQRLASDGKITSVPAEVPGLRVIAEGPSQIMIRQTTQYEIRVENRGAVEAPGVLVRTAIPAWIAIRSNQATRGNINMAKEAGVPQLLWKIDTLPAGAVERLTIQVEAEKSGSFGVAVDWTLLPQKNELLVNVQEPKLQLLIEGPDQVVFGESETYKVRVLNPGDGAAANVVFTLSPNSATPQTQQIGVIPAGKEAHFEVELTAQDLGDLQVHGLATGDLQLRTEGTKTIRVAAAQLEAMLTGPALRYQNSETVYKLNLQNKGLAASNNVVATLRLPAGVEYLGGLETAQVAGDTLSWKMDRLEPGATRDYEFRCNMGTTGAHLLAFECQGSAAGRALVSLTTRVEALADLVLSINDPPAPAPIGEDVVYELVITNRGSKAATDIQALTHFSDHLEPISIEGHSGKISVGQVLFDAIPRIDPGQTLTIRIVAQAHSEGHHRFRAEITSGETVLIAEEATRYLSPVNEQVSRRSSDTTSR